MNIKQLLFISMFASAFQLGLAADTQSATDQAKDITRVIKENVNLTGPVTINESTIYNATIKGDVTVDASSVFDLNVDGNAKFSRARIKNLTLTGNLDAKYTSIDQLTVSGSEIAFSYSNVNKIIVKNDKNSQEQIIKLNDNSNVRSIVFESKNGLVIVDNTMTTTPDVQGGKIEKK
jgi:hypothetical protein